MESVYIETSVVSVLVSNPSRDPLIAERQRETRAWWERARLDFCCVTSSEVVNESERGDPELARRRIAVVATLPLIAIDERERALARKLMACGALPPFATSDALHLAAAAIAHVDFLATWDCKHLANARILRRLDQEARKWGWSLPLACMPPQIAKKGQTDASG